VARRLIIAAQANRCVIPGRGKGYPLPQLSAQECAVTGLSPGAGAYAGAAVASCLVLDDVSGDDNAVLDGVGAGIGVDRAACLKRA
jgi:hypothetical protein